MRDRRRLLLRVAGAAAFLALIVGSRSRITPRFGVYAGSTSIDAAYSDMGERLIHRLPGEVTTRMASATISNAFLFNHASADSVLKLLPPYVEIALLFAIAGLLAPEGSLLALLTLALVLSLGRAEFYTGTEEACYSLFVILVCGLMIMRAQSPTPLRSLLLGCGIGASLLYRSPLILLPPLLAAVDWTLGRKSFRDIRPWMVLVVPYLFLVPWVWLNRALPGHRWALIEDGSSGLVIVQGALGFVLNLDHKWEQLATAMGVAQDSVRGPLWFATTQILHHPLRYLVACAQRLRYGFLLHPGLVLAAGLGSVVSRKRADIRETALLCAYFIGVYCLSAVEARYFKPIWPLVALLAGTNLLAFLPESDAGRESLERRLSSGIIGLWFAVVMAFSLYVLGCVSAYAMALPRMQSQPTLDRAIDAYPKDHWLLYTRGKLNAREGRIEEAERDLSRASALRPAFIRYRLALAWVMALRGHPDRLLSWGIGSNEAAVLKAAFFARLGRMKDAVRELRTAYDEDYPGQRRKDRAPSITASQSDLLRKVDWEGMFIDEALWMMRGPNQLLGDEPGLRRALAAAFPSARDPKYRITEP